MMQDNQSQQTQTHEPKQASSYRWPIIIVSILTIHTTLMVLVVVTATGGRGAVAQPQAYERSLNWSAEQEQLRRSKALGWTIDIVPADQKTSDGKREVAFYLRTADDEPINDASLQVWAWHRISPNRVEHVKLSQRDGVFETSLDMYEYGFWEFRFQATAGTTQYFNQQALWIPEAKQ